MKKIRFIFPMLAIPVLTFFYYSCNKDKGIAPTNIVTEIDEASSRIFNSEEILSIVSDINGSTKAPPKWMRKIKEWIVAHSGTHLFQNCQGGGSCGPCPGICITNGIMDGDDNGSDQLDSLDYAQGLRLYVLSLIEHKETREEAMLFEFTDYLDDFVYNGYLIFDEDVEASSTLCALYSKNRITLLQGSYPVVYDSITQASYTVVNCNFY